MNLGKQIAKLLIFSLLYLLPLISIACPPGYYESDICAFGNCVCLPKGNLKEPPPEYDFCVVVGPENNGFPKRYCKNCRSKLPGDAGNIDCNLRTIGGMQYAYPGRCEANEDKCMHIKE